MEKFENNIFFKNILYCKQIDSTNEWAKRYFYSAKNIIENTVFLADVQTSGKGRLSRTWLCDPKKQINISILTCPTKIDSTHLQLICLCAALAIYNSIKVLSNLPCEVKWPNDILINKRKVCGILCESIFYSKNNTPSAIIVGIGINVNNNKFDKSIAKKATSIYLESKKIVSKKALIGLILKEFSLYFQKFNMCQFEDIIKEYKSCCATLNRKIEFERTNKIVYATAIDINNLGELIVKTPYGEIFTLNHEEIFYNNIYKNEV